MRTSLFSIARIVALGILVPLAQAAAQTQHEIVRGRVVGDSGHAVRGAQVVVIRAQDSAWKSATTDSLGRYATEWPDGLGAYTVGVTAVGYAPARISVARQHPTDSILIADVRLVVSAAQRLAPVISRAT